MIPLRWALASGVAMASVAIATWDVCAFRWASERETISARFDLLCRAYPAVAFASGAALVFCTVLPLMPRRRRWVAAFVVLLEVLAAVCGHALWHLRG